MQVAQEDNEVKPQVIVVCVQKDEFHRHRSRQNV